MNTKRLQSLRKVLENNGLQALLVTKRENVFYLSGFRGEGVLLIALDGEGYLITDPRFTQEADEEIKTFKTESTDGLWVKAVGKIVKRERIKRLGFESEWLSHSDFVRLSSGLGGIKPIPKQNLIEAMRMFKDKTELACLRKAASIIKKTFFYIKGVIKPELSGGTVAAEIDVFMRSHGAARSAFQTIVAGSPNSSCPHAPASKKKFAKNEAVLVDMGCVYKRYYSDLTRMLILGKISAKFKSVYKTVRVAQDKALKKIKAGVRISEIDNEARQHIANKGLGEFFIHGLGHGIGLEIHELPLISKKNRELLRPGMVFSVEPGIYIPGWGGVRLEDMVLVTETGCEVLTGDIPK